MIYWTLGIDPIFSVLLGSVPAYFFGVWFTENIFAQRPLVAQASCPEAECQALFNVFFGDLFSVMTDGIVAPKGPPADTVLCKCPICKIDLEADRASMILITANSKVVA